MLGGHRRNRPIITADDRKKSSRRMQAIVMNRIGTNLFEIVCTQRASGIWVGIEARAIRAADVNCDAMSLVEGDARGPEIDLEFVNLALLHKHFAIEAFAE